MQRFVTDENKKWWTLAAVSVGLFMIMLDNTVVNVALPSIRSSLDMGIEGLEWVVAGYALTFAAFMLIGGKLADFLGRRLIFMIGLAVFTGASLACGLAPNGSFLIGARIVQGLGGALMNPATLSIITATFEPRERGKAIGIWAGVSALALAIGPLVGGLLTEHVNWNWIFFINVPIGVLGLFTAPDLHRGVARPVGRPAARRAGPRDLGGRPLLAHLRVHRGEQVRLGLVADPRRVRDRGGRARHLRAARAASARPDARPVAVPQPHVRRRERGDALRRPRDVRDVLLRLALHAERAALLAGRGGRELPADDDPDHPDRAARGRAHRSRRLALARRRRHDAARPDAPLLLAARRGRELLGAPARSAARRDRHGR